MLNRLESAMVLDRSYIHAADRPKIILSRATYTRDATVTDIYLTITETIHLSNLQLFSNPSQYP